MAKDIDETPKWFRWIPLIALVIAVCALTFQVTVLYPWHEELSKQFGSLARKVRA